MSKKAKLLGSEDLPVFNQTFISRANRKKYLPVAGSTSCTGCSLYANYDSDTCARMPNRCDVLETPPEVCFVIFKEV